MYEVLLVFRQIPQDLAGNIVVQGSKSSIFYSRIH